MENRKLEIFSKQFGLDKVSTKPELSPLLSRKGGILLLESLLALIEVILDILSYGFLRACSIRPILLSVLIFFQIDICPINTRNGTEALIDKFEHVYTVINSLKDANI